MRGRTTEQAASPRRRRLPGLKRSSPQSACRRCPAQQHRAGTPTLAARTAASGSVALSWSPGPADARRWEYRQRPEGGGWSAWIRIAGSNALTASHTVTGLIQDARYSFQVRAANARASGPGSAAASAVAGLTPTVVSDFEPLLYHRLQSADGAMRDSPYAFLTEADDLTSGARTFAETSGAVALLINTEGYGGRDYTAALATVQVGDRISWSRDNKGLNFDCRYDYRVIEILPDPPEPSRRLFRIALEDESVCNISVGAAQRSELLRSGARVRCRIRAERSHSPCGSGRRSPDVV